MSSVPSLPFRAVWFLLWLGVQIVRSAGGVVADVLTPGQYATPRVVRMPLESRHDVHVALIGALITLTPGTLTLGVVEEEAAQAAREAEEGPDGGDGPARRALLVHSMYDDDAESALTSLRAMERRMLRGLSLRGGPS